MTGTHDTLKSLGRTHGFRVAVTIRGASLKVFAEHPGNGGWEMGERGHQARRELLDAAHGFITAVDASGIIVITPPEITIDSDTLAVRVGGFGPAYQTWIRITFYTPL